MQHKKHTPAQIKAAEKQYLKRLEEARAQHTLNPYETVAAREVRIARAKVDFNYFVRTYFPRLAHHDCAPFHIEDAISVLQNKHCRYLKAQGRGTGKSMIWSTLLPLWLWINEEIKVMVIASQKQEKAEELLQPIKAQFEGNLLLIQDFSAQKTDTEWTAKKIVTANGCVFFAASIGADPRGLRHLENRIDYIVGDDMDTKEVCRNPKRLRQAVNWFMEDLVPTTSPRGSRVIVVNNIFAKKTILTTIRDEYNDSGVWKYSQVNATDEMGNPTWDFPGAREYYDLQRQTMGVLSFESEYNNRPYSQGAVFTDDMILWAEIPPLSAFDRILSTWDVAYSSKPTADFNAVRIWGLYQKKFYLIDCFVKQATMKEAIKWMFDKKIEMQNEYRVPFYFESQFWNEALQMVFDEVAKDFPPGTLRLIKMDSAKGNKLDRIMELHPLYQQKRIYYNRAHQANGYFAEGIDQLKGIEPGYKSHDDAPDTDAAAIEMLAKHANTGTAKHIAIRKKNRKY